MAPTVGTDLHPCPARYWFLSSMWSLTHDDGMLFVLWPRWAPYGDPLSLSHTTAQ